jgi:hypothetical protein
VVYFPLYHEEVLEAEEIKVKRTQTSGRDKNLVQTKEAKRIDRPVRSASHGRGLSVRLEAVYKYKGFMHRGGGGTREETQLALVHGRDELIHLHTSSIREQEQHATYRSRARSEEHPWRRIQAFPRVRTKIELHPFSSLCLAASIVDGDSDAAAMVLAIVQPNGRRVRHTNEARRRLSDRGELESMRATPWRGVTGVQVQPRLLDVQVHGVPLGSWKRPGLPVRPRARRIGAAGRRHLCRSGSVYGRSLEHAMSSSALGGRPAYRSPRSLTYRCDAAAVYGSSFVCRPTSIRCAGLVRRRRTEAALTDANRGEGGSALDVQVDVMEQLGVQRTCAARAFDGQAVAGSTRRPRAAPDVQVHVGCVFGHQRCCHGRPWSAGWMRPVGDPR